ncbi:hypothetical protein BJ508DRAFT_311027 [Ascobolus immersus RN42]|uniref:Uncharacterized protein n=1 Tax=Ascobolus immersus RN42 TaxID=1160509 RepID=A0A3N4HS33_ASCIM|nr:hypothetical protein BJ508DRAFT_311027 [Ascobolus immersus RN42]
MSRKKKAGKKRLVRARQSSTVASRESSGCEQSSNNYRNAITQVDPRYTSELHLAPPAPPAPPPAPPRSYGSFLRRETSYDEHPWTVAYRAQPPKTTPSLSLEARLQRIRSRRQALLGRLATMNERRRIQYEEMAPEFIENGLDPPEYKVITFPFFEPVQPNLIAILEEEIDLYEYIFDRWRKDHIMAVAMDESAPGNDPASGRQRILNSYDLLTANGFNEGKRPETEEEIREYGRMIFAPGGN